jgi:hypothetical protein
MQHVHFQTVAVVAANGQRNSSRRHVHVAVVRVPVFAMIHLPVLHGVMVHALVLAVLVVVACSAVHCVVHVSVLAMVHAIVVHLVVTAVIGAVMISAKARRLRAFASIVALQVNIDQLHERLIQGRLHRSRLG